MNQYQLIDGFELLGGTWDARRLTAIETVPGKTNIALFKLHGSTNWPPRRSREINGILPTL